MRRKDREITDFHELVELLDCCDVLHLGLCDGDMPYVVPLSFGYEVTEEKKIQIYVHGASEGRKIDLLQKSGKVCVEFDRFFRYDQFSHGITARYESLIGFGQAEEVTGEEKIHGLNLLNSHCGYVFDAESCPSLDHTKCFRITLDSISGKRNLRKL